MLLLSGSPVQAKLPTALLETVVMGMERRAGWAGWLLFAAVAVYVAFLFPFRFPPTHAVLSAAYQVGWNNRLSAIALALLSVGVGLYFLLRGDADGATRPEANAERPLSLAYLWLAVGLTTAWTLGLGLLVARSHLTWGDYTYFLHQLRTGVDFHRRLYTDFEFPYGPVLYLWPAWFVRALGAMGVAARTAYLGSLLLLQILGMVLWFYVVRALPASTKTRAVAFLALGLSALTPLLGINYALFRFALAFALVTMLVRRATLAGAAGVALLGGFFSFAVSPEIGIGFSAACVAVAGYRLVRGKWAWLVTIPCAFAGAAVLLAVVGQRYFETLGGVAKGGYNLVLQPVPNVFPFLFALLVLAPMAVARLVRADGRDGGQHGVWMAGLYTVSLAALPAALGRCDALHIFFNGLGIYLLSLVAADALSPRRRRLWWAVLGFALLWTAGANLRVYGSDFTHLIHHNLPVEDQVHDEPGLLAALGGGKLYAPTAVPEPLLDDLTARGQYQPGYFNGLEAVFDAEAETRVLGELSAAHYVLAPADGIGSMEVLDNSRFKRLFRFGITYPELHPPVLIGARLGHELEAEFHPIGKYGVYVLYQRNF